MHAAGLTAKPECGIQFGAGGDTSAEELEAFGTSDPSKIINMGKRFIDAGVERIMIESEGHHGERQELEDGRHPEHPAGAANGKGHV